MNNHTSTDIEILDSYEINVDAGNGSERPQKVVCVREDFLQAALLRERMTAYADCGSKGGESATVRAYAKSRANELKNQLNQTEGEDDPK